MQASGSASVLDRSAAVGLLRMREHSSTISYTVSSSPASHGKVKCVRRLCYTAPSLLHCPHSPGRSMGCGGVYRVCSRAGQGLGEEKGIQRENEDKLFASLSGGDPPLG